MIVTIIGARPQFIKAAVVSKAFQEVGVEEKIIHTGQHYDEEMSAVFWKELGIPKYEVNLNVGSGTHGQQTAQMIVKVEEYLISHKEKIKGVLLYGDTNSTIAGSIAASKLGIKIIHIESGLRSFNKMMPEEVNRVVTDHLSDLLFCPSQHSVDQLKKEGITDHVYNVGDVMYDALLQFSLVAQQKASKENTLAFPTDEPFYLLTVHRPSNTDEPQNLRQILDALSSFSTKCVWPVHPRTKRILSESGQVIPSNVVMTSPFSYFDMLMALKHCEKVMTDSGGLQKEAYWMRKPCITLRTETEWVETLANNWNILTGPNEQKIIQAMRTPVDNSTWTNLYGDGNAAKYIARKIKEIVCR